MIIYLYSIAIQLLDAIIDHKKIVKSHIPAANIPMKLEVPVEQSINTTANELKVHLKCGRPIGVNDKSSWKRKA
jgi:hypothetical protein